MLRRLNTRGMTILMVTHSIECAANALNEALADIGWPDRGARIQAFIGPPYSGTQAALELFAQTIWRHSLRCFPETAPLPEPAHESGNPDREITLWVIPWSQINLPAMPRETNRQHLFLLHALLIHGWLSLDLLCVADF